MRKRDKFIFATIGEGSAYEELNQLKSLPSSKRLHFNSLFDAVEGELNQVKIDVSRVYDIVEKDIETEIDQMERVELQLKKSLKRVNHIYEIALKCRSRNVEYESSKIIYDFSKSIENLKSNINGLDGVIINILDIMAQVDSKFSARTRLLNEQIFNEHHYPLFYELLRKRCPQAFDKGTDLKNEENNFHEILENPNIPDISSVGYQTSLNAKSSSSNNNEKVAKDIENTISHYRLSKSHGKSQPALLAPKAFIPASLRGMSSPLTSTSFETVSARDFCCTDSSIEGEGNQKIS